MVTKKLYLYFPRSEVEKPIVYQLVKEYDLVINIFRAKVTPEEEGYLVLDVSGSEENVNRAMEFLRTFDVRIDTVNKGVRWDRERCTHCGNCVVHCPTSALEFEDRETRQVRFDEEACIECLSCLENCPFQACYSVF